MLNVVKTTAGSKDQQTVTDYIHEGIVTLSPLQMNAVIKECGYDGQRPVNDRHVIVLADLMRRGQWQPKSQIDFAQYMGRLILVNGYHRAYAQVRSGNTVEWAVAVHRVKTEAELRALYHAFDTNVRIRSGRDIMKANAFGEAHGLNAESANSLFAAVPYLSSRFELSNPHKRNFLVDRQVDLRLRVAADYAKAAARFWACMDGLPAVRKSRFKSGAMMAVAAATFRYQNETAWRFWTGVVQNDGLKRGDPRLALVSDLMIRRTRAGSVEGYAPAIIAWNAFFNERELKLIKVLDSFVPVIDGTPFDGKPVKLVA